jgi:hypothetical protein
MQLIKEELSDADTPEGLAPAREVEILVGFTQDEWEQLTEVIILVFYYSSY